MLFIVLAVCAAPLIFSYLTYYVIKPEGRTNYGDLIDPRAHPIPELGLQQLDGQSASLEQFSGKWILLQVDQAACAKPCTDKLYYMRQLRLTQGKEMDRIERVWLVTDDAPLDTALMKQYDGTRLLRVDPKKLAAWLPVQAGTQPADHLYLIDPLGNLMMRFPKDPDANKIKKDISRLLKASRIG
ncbi:MAG: cytochrome C oxidase subunit I [Oxalobacteraceae bacterium]|jgi:cytochrome oxidase Cu insertion factor (SCO1/SenC/PrrC family)|nr:cytochrome C oxidase subunit I [Oxalobacteraceae bacterium]